MDNMIGKKLDGRYLLNELIGIGGMANVYRATDLKTQNTVAVKILKEEFTQNEELVHRFKNESKAISILDHPNIVKVFDVSVTDKLQYLVMEYIDGITLKEYLNQRGGPLTWKETLHFITQILSALQHAHSKGVVHRDIKPQNIMLLPDGSLKMMDFGIARISRAENCTLGSDKAIGSVHYISPEQARGELTDAKSDIYSVGVMLYEMLSGKLPFEGDSAVNVAIRQIAEKPKPLSEVAENVPEALCQITEKAMAKNPRNRYQSAAEMLEAIDIFKQNPSVRFAYRYLADEEQHQIEKVMRQKKKESEKMMSNREKTSSPKNRTVSRTRAASPNGTAPRKKPAKKKRSVLLPVMFGMAVAFACGAAILCYLIFTNSTNPLFSSREDVDLVNFVGMQKSDIESNSAYDVFNIVYDEQYNNNVPAGEVYSQTPKPPREVKEGQTVTLKVSLGTLWVTVPEVTDFTQADAESTLKDKGLSVTVRRVVDETVAEGSVIKTSPAAGEQVASGDSVVVYVSQAKIETTCIVPNVVGLTMGDVQTALKNNNLTAGTIIQQYSDSAVDTIISQDPVAGTEVKVRTKVTLVISVGPEPEPEPEENHDDDDD